MAGAGNKESLFSLALDLSQLERNQNVEENNANSSFLGLLLSGIEEKGEFKASYEKTVETGKDEALFKNNNNNLGFELFKRFSHKVPQNRVDRMKNKNYFEIPSDRQELYLPPKYRTSSHGQNSKDGKKKNKKIDSLSVCCDQRKGLLAQKGVGSKAVAMHDEDPRSLGDNPAAHHLKSFHDGKGWTTTRFLQITGLNNPRDEKSAEVERTTNCKLAPSIPASAFGTRRKQSKQSKIPLQTKSRISGVRIANYRPDYVWNRGGRLKEIRIRYLARKFAFIWERKVFGRLSPAATRSYWRHKTLVKYIRLWHTITWHSRGEWRLLVRADCHYRFWLRVKTFRAWRLYVRLQQQKKIELEKSLQFYNWNQLRRRFVFWRFYVESRCKKSQLLDNALQFNKRRCYRNVLKVWHEQMLKANAEKDLILKAELWKRRRLQKLTLQKWVGALCIQQEHFKKQQIASHHRNRFLVRKSLLKWSDYVNQRRRKLEMKINAKEFCEWSITCRAFGVWTNQFHHHQMLYENAEHFRQLQIRLLLRQMWSHWRHYISDQRRKKLNIEKAQFHCKQKRLILGLAGFQLHVNYVRNFNHLAERLLTETQHLSVRKCFLVWMHKFDLREEMRRRPLTIKALQFYRHQLLKKSFRKLKHYVSWRCHRQTQYAKAEAHFYVSWFPKCLRNWREAVKIVKQQKRLRTQAQEYWEENTLCNIFYTWQEATNQNHKYQQMEMTAVLHYNNRLLHGSMRIWQLRTSDCLKHCHLLKEADNYLRWRTLRRTLLAWKQYVNEVHNMRYQDVISLACYYGNIQNRCFSAWKQYCIHRKAKRKRLAEVSDYYERCLSVKVWKMWRSYVARCQQKSNMAEEKYRKVSLRTLQWAFHIWQDNSHEATEERKNCENAQRYYNQRLLSKVLGTWRNFAAVQNYKKSQIQTLVLSAQKSLQTALVHCLFIKWRRSCHENVVDKQKEFLALSHYRSVVLRKSFHCWKLWLLATYKKKLLVRQSVYFRHRVLLISAFNQWITTLDIVRHEKHRTHLALWHWSANLQRKVLLAWKSYYSERLRKHARITSAIAARRQRLLREGLQCWISTADQLANWRKTNADRQQTQSTVSTFNKVRRFAHRWHQKTIAARSQKFVVTAPHSGITRHRPIVFPEISIGDPSISFTSEVLAPAHRPQPLYPSFLDDSHDVEFENSNSEHHIKMTKAATKYIEKQLMIENPAVNVDPPKSEEGPVKPIQMMRAPPEISSETLSPANRVILSPEPEIQQPVWSSLMIANPVDKLDPPKLGGSVKPIQITRTPSEISSERLSPADLVVISPEPRIKQPVNVQSDMELQNPVSKDPGPCQIPEKDSDILLMTPNDFQVSKEATDENLRGEVVETNKLLLNYKSQREKLASLKEYLRMLQSWETKDPDISSIDVELSQTELDIAVLKKSLHEQKQQLKARVQKLTQNSLQP